MVGCSIAGTLCCHCSHFACGSGRSQIYQPTGCGNCCYLTVVGFANIASGGGVGFPFAVDDLQDEETEGKLEETATIELTTGEFKNQTGALGFAALCRAEDEKALSA